MSGLHYIKLHDRIICTKFPQNWSEGKKLSQEEGKRLFRQQCAIALKRYFKPGDTVYTALNKVSSSGMSRHISVIGAMRKTYIDGNGKKRIQCIPINLSSLVADLLEYKLADDGALIVGDCGMDMGFHVVYSMSSAMWPKGTDKPHGRRNGSPDSHGGYALNHKWL